MPCHITFSRCHCLACTAAMPCLPCQTLPIGCRTNTPLLSRSRRMHLCRRPLPKKLPRAPFRLPPIPCRTRMAAAAGQYPPSVRPAGGQRSSAVQSGRGRPSLCLLHTCCWRRLKPICRTMTHLPIGVGDTVCRGACIGCECLPSPALWRRGFAAQQGDVRAAVQEGGFAGEEAALPEHQVAHVGRVELRVRLLRLVRHIQRQLRQRRKRYRVLSSACTTLSAACQAGCHAS